MGRAQGQFMPRFLADTLGCHAAVSTGAAVRQGLPWVSSMGHCKPTDLTGITNAGSHAAQADTDGHKQLTNNRAHLTNRAYV